MTQALKIDSSNIFNEKNTNLHIAFKNNIILQFVL
jgi:hypothetical protein